ncbi:MAG: hypothetical protein ACKV22_15110 [Bryobacteraceae bacterium]
MRASVLLVLSAAVSGLFGQTAIEYGATAGKAAAAAAGIGVAIKGTMGTTARHLDRSKDAPTTPAGRRRAMEAARAADLAEAARVSRSSTRRSPDAARAATTRVAATQPVAVQPTPAQAAVLRVSRPLPPAREPTVIDPAALKSGMPRAELDALGTPAMSITDAEGETRIYKTAKGSVSVVVKDGRIAGIQL